MEKLGNISLKLYPMEYADVELTDSMFKKQFDEMVDYFLNIPDDDILLGYRRRAGLPHPGTELGGWYCNDASYNIYDWDDIFNVFPQWLAMFARVYRETGDKRVYEKARHLLTEWGKTIAEDGYFFYSDDCNAHHYAYREFTTALIELYEFCGFEDALVYLKKITGWAEKNLARFRNYAKGPRLTFTGGEPSIKVTDNEWYTLSEGLYRAYLLTGDEQYYNFARVWDYDAYWCALRNWDREFMRRIHGYSHVNTLGGAAMEYRISGDKKYLETLLAGYEIIKRYQRLASGGYAIDEHMQTPEWNNYEDIVEIGRTFEVGCCSWAILKAVRHLISITGEARYGEWAEGILYNAIGAALPMKDDSFRRGKTFYYSDYRLGGGRKVYFECSFPCCSGSGPHAIAEYYNTIYYTDETGVYISQYIPSVVKTECGGQTVEVEVSGNYPAEDTFQILVKQAGTYRIALRAPDWIVPGESTIMINGMEADADIVPEKWIILDRHWKGNEVIEVRFPMHLYTFGITDYHPERAAVKYGPIMLAAEGQHPQMAESYKDLRVMERSKTYTEKGLCFTACGANGEEVIFRPYWTFKEKEWYTVYTDFIK